MLLFWFSDCASTSHKMGWHCILTKLSFYVSYKHHSNVDQDCLKWK